MINHLHVRMRSCHIVEVPSYTVDIAGQGFQIVYGFSDAKISRTQNMLDFIGNKKLSKLCRQAVGPMRDMKVADDQNELNVTLQRIFGFKLPSGCCRMGTEITIVRIFYEIYSFQFYGGLKVISRHFEHRGV